MQISEGLMEERHLQDQITDNYWEICEFEWQNTTLNNLMFNKTASKSVPSTNLLSQFTNSPLARSPVQPQSSSKEREIEIGSDKTQDQDVASPHYFKIEVQSRAMRQNKLIEPVMIALRSNSFLQYQKQSQHQTSQLAKLGQTAKMQPAPGLKRLFKSKEVLNLFHNEKVNQLIMSGVNSPSKQNNKVDKDRKVKPSYETPYTIYVESQNQKRKLATQTPISFSREVSQRLTKIKGFQKSVKAPPVGRNQTEFNFWQGATTRLKIVPLLSKMTCPLKSQTKEISVTKASPPYGQKIREAEDRKNIEMLFGYSIKFKLVRNSNSSSYQACPS